jgi:glycosyltransferase involved in cell wall biosynthesis
MRIAVDATAAISGGKVYLDHLLPCLAQMPFDHQFIVFHVGDFRDAPPTSDRRFEYHQVRLPAFAARHPLAGSLLKMLWRLVVLPSHLSRLQPDLLFSNAGFGPAYRPPRTQLILALHNSMPLQDELFATELSLFKRLRLILLKRLLLRTLRDCDGLIVFSQDLKRRIVAQVDYLKREPSVVYHGIEWGEKERAHPADLERLAGLGVRPPYLLYVSHFHRYKNVLRLLEAFATARPGHPDLSLVLAGDAADREHWVEVEATIRRLGLETSVKHVGQRSRNELKDLYGGALALVYPSLVENCPFAVLEALAFGLPIAAARATSLPEICGEAAVFFDPYRPDEIAAVLGRVVSDAALREDLRRKAVARSRAFSWPESARQTLIIFEQVGAGRSAARDSRPSPPPISRT